MKKIFNKSQQHILFKRKHLLRNNIEKCVAVAVVVIIVGSCFPLSQLDAFFDVFFPQRNKKTPKSIFMC